MAAAAFAVLLPGDGRDLAVSFAFALVAFLVFNRPPARIYLGDGGSYLLGTGLAALVALAWRAPVTGTTRWSAAVAALCSVSIPVAELAFAVIRRLRATRLDHGGRPATPL